MFKKTQVPLLGCVLNMSSFECPSCGTKSSMGQNFQSLLDTCDIELLSELPYHGDVAVAADSGTPMVLAQPESSHVRSQHFL